MVKFRVCAEKLGGSIFKLTLQEKSVGGELVGILVFNVGTAVFKFGFILSWNKLSSQILRSHKVTNICTLF